MSEDSSRAETANPAARGCPAELVLRPIPGGSLVVRGFDRRGRPTPRVSPYTFWGGRRKWIRREQEREGTFVDVYGWKVACMILWVALMNVGDSFFTLLHLQFGGIELNPVAQALLGTGRWGFVFIKSFLIALALVVLAIHKNFFLARVGMWTATGTYTLLVIYHLYLLGVR